MKTAELSGVALDWAVAKCEELKLKRLSGGEFLLSNGDFWFPSTDWAQGGQIIELEGISIEYTGWGGNEGWIANHDHETDWQGHTPLVAAMRCYVASKLGDEVETPFDLEVAE